MSKIETDRREILDAIHALEYANENDYALDGITDEDVKNFRAVGGAIFELRKNSAVRNLCRSLNLSMEDVLNIAIRFM